MRSEEELRKEGALRRGRRKTEAGSTEDKRGDECPGLPPRAAEEDPAAALEEEAAAKPRKKPPQEEREERKKEAPGGGGGRPPQIDPAKATPNNRRTHRPVRLMKDGATGGFIQAYNAQVAVDEERQGSWPAPELPTKTPRFLPLLAETQTQLGRLPEKVSADTGRATIT